MLFSYFCSSSLFAQYSLLAEFINRIITHDSHNPQTANKILYSAENIQKQLATRHNPPTFHFIHYNEKLH
jgi:hypothetical protein